MSSTKFAPCSMPKRRALANVVLIGFGVVYPAIVFFLRGTVAPSLFIVLALAIVALRLTIGEVGIGGWRPALAVAAAALAGLALIDAALAARAYPVLLSLAAAGVFAGKKAIRTSQAGPDSSAESILGEETMPVMALTVLPATALISTGPSQQTACSVTRAESSSTMRTAGRRHG